VKEVCPLADLVDTADFIGSYKVEIVGRQWRCNSFRLSLYRTVPLDFCLATLTKVYISNILPQLIVNLIHL